MSLFHEPQFWMVGGFIVASLVGIGALRWASRKGEESAREWAAGYTQCMNTGCRTPFHPAENNLKGIDSFFFCSGACRDAYYGIHYPQEVKRG